VYQYLPRGECRLVPCRYVFATMITMALFGLWHGAGWSYVVWGLWHGLGLIVCRSWQQLKRPLPTFVGWAITFAFVVAGWVLFRSSSFGAAGGGLGSVVGGGGGGGGAGGGVFNIGRARGFVRASLGGVIQGGEGRPRPAVLGG